MASPAPAISTAPDASLDLHSEDPSTATLPPGTLLGTYQLGRVVGRGGMGAVYEGVHTGVGKRVAIKTLLPHLANSRSSTQRFLREAKAAGRVRHPHTVDVTDVGVSDGVPFLVMELLEGENLLDRLARTGPMRPDIVVDLMLPVCSALVTAHTEGVVHRDLKPENIFVSRTRAGSEVVKVLDFGISHIAQDDGAAVRLTGTNNVIGTPRYMSPEQTKGAKNADARSDQWSVGVMMYQCLTSQLPYDGDSFLEILQKLATTKAPAPGKLTRGIPSGLDAVVMRTLSKDNKQRYASMRDLARALLPFASPHARAIWEPSFAEGALAPREERTLRVAVEGTMVVERPRASEWPRAIAMGIAAGLALALLAFFGWYVVWVNTPTIHTSPLPPAPPTATTTPPPTTTAPTPPEVPLPTGMIAPPATLVAPPATTPTGTTAPRDLTPPRTTRTDRGTRPPPSTSTPPVTTTTPVESPRPPETTPPSSTVVGPNGAVILR